jgi:hypothetical protein
MYIKKNKKRKIKKMKNKEVTNKVKVTVIPLGNRIKYRIFGRVYCSTLKKELANSMTLNKRDGVWLTFFGGLKNVNKFLAKNKSITKVINPYLLHYMDCDSTNAGVLKKQ